MSDKPNSVFIACPLHNGWIDGDVAEMIYLRSSCKYPVIPAKHTCGALTFNFNMMLCHALNVREAENIRWFAMLHSDVFPAEWWVDTLIEEAEKNDADIMSAVVPLKDARGVTSTAISDPDNPWSPWCRLTLNQLLHEDFPETFDANMATRALANLPENLRVVCPDGAGLEVNVGCFIYRLDRPWSDKIAFRLENRISRINGEYHAEFQSDDWLFSRDVSRAGGRVFATRKVSLVHRGGGGYCNNRKWGQLTDTDCLKFRETATREQMPEAVRESARVAVQEAAYVAPVMA